MPNTFAELYASLLKNDVFTVQARENLAQGADGLTCALAYAAEQAWKRGIVVVAAAANDGTAVPTPRSRLRPVRAGCRIR